MGRRWGFHDCPGAVRWLLIGNLAASALLWLIVGISAMAGYSGWKAVNMFALPGGGVAFLHRPWTIITYMFTQANPLQLLFNMLWLVWFGRVLCISEGEKRLSALYMGGGLTGGVMYLLSTILLPGSGTELLGSSAAVLSVMTYTALKYPDLDVPLLLIGEVRLKWIAVFTIIITLLGATGVAAHCAHIGGILFPLALRATQRYRNRKPRLKVPKAMRSYGSDNPETTLDSLLDKIRVSGYDSLNRKEKKLLDEVSQKIKD